MHKLEKDQYPRIEPLLEGIHEIHLNATAICRCTAPGEIWADDPVKPSVAFIKGPEGEYLLGDHCKEKNYSALKEIIPLGAYLTVYPAGWEDVLPLVWADQAARRHPRLHMRWQGSDVPDWRALLPNGYEMAAIDRDFLNRTGLVNHDEVAWRVHDWFSTDYFLQYGFCFCVLHDNTIASYCISDWATDSLCEIGITTDLRYRRQGLGFIAVTAALEHCLSRGFTHVGWHCLRSNTGSWKLAEKAGFRIVAEYNAFSSALPAENAGDLTQAEYINWAEHYEKFAATDHQYRLFSADARALSGESEKALQHLRLLIEEGWRCESDWLMRHWELDSLRGMPEFEVVLAEAQKLT